MLRKVNLIKVYSVNCSDKKFLNLFSFEVELQNFFLERSGKKSVKKFLFF